MFDNQCKYYGNPCQQSEEPLPGGNLKHKSDSLENMQTVRQNKNECIQLMEQTYELLNAVLMVHIKSETGAELPPTVLNIWESSQSMLLVFEKLLPHDNNYCHQNLHKIHTFVEAQQNGSKIKKFFHQGEMSTLLKDCKAGLQQGLHVFQITMVKHMKDIAEMKKDAENQHKELCRTQPIQMEHPLYRNFNPL
ncbi:hypothetical protein B0H13DRAFT_1871623 [Mycena leptocephala]|nr:hypothetical protein B0H13DRAFT_1871623 [Mycena leptocephala]